MSNMAHEARQSPEAVQIFLDRNRTELVKLGNQLASSPPPGVLTSARGSSDHAAAYFKYVSEILTGTPCASLGASVVSIYGTQLKARNWLALTISQSGKSPDIVALQQSCRASGALTVAIVNTPDSPVGQNAQVCLPLHAGPEKSIAATKSFITSLVAGASIVAAWTGDKELEYGLAALPEQLHKATRLAWDFLIETTQDANSLYVVGRGPSYPVACETALKLKETCAMHAEAFSAAEVMHGPRELIGQDFPILAFAQRDASFPHTFAAIEKLKETGARVMMVGEDRLPVITSRHPLLDPVLIIQTAYLAIEQMARARRRDPDKPKFLSKVTETT